MPAVACRTAPPDFAHCDLKEVGEREALVAALRQRNLSNAERARLRDLCARAHGHYWHVAETTDGAA